MGADKALIPWEGRPLIEHVVQRLRPACDPIVVVHAPDQTLPPLEGVTALSDPPDRAGAGPLAGLLTGLEQLQRAGVSLAFVSACDAPFVGPEHVAALVTALIPRADAAAPRLDQQTQFLSAVVRVEPVLATASQLVTRGERSLRALFQVLEVCEVTAKQLPDPRALRTFNTPEELAALRELDS
jgi:molybdopterin-guanine dinucleotide biosynthesis protein A